MDNLKDFIGEDDILCSWATDDIVHIVNNAKYHSYKNISWIKKYIDIQKYCTKILAHKKSLSLKHALEEQGIYEVDGFIFDLGVSSYQLDTPERGFSYMNDGPLDMRMDKEAPITAEIVVNEYESDKLLQIIRDYGEERWAKRIVEFIVAARNEKRITTTGELVSIIKKAIPAKARQDGPHPAKRTFQAIRIEVNRELAILHDSFVDAVSMLKPKGRIGVITFHSLEDRITKQTFKELSTACICPPELPVCVCHHKAVLKAKNKAIEPSAGEVEMNPRSRSAKLRVGIKL